MALNIEYHILLNDDECLAPEQLERIEKGWFLYHSPDHNFSIIRKKTMVANFDIRVGAEILLDLRNQSI